MLCVCVCVHGKGVGSPGFTAFHVEMFSYGRSSFLDEGYAVAIHKAILFSQF